MYLTHEIIDAIRAAMGDDFGSQQLFARKVGTSCANVSRWLNGKNRRITKETWQKLQPHITDFLKPSGSDPVSEIDRRLDTPGVTIRVSGVSYERIAAALESVDYLSLDQKRDIIARIFFDYADKYSFKPGNDLGGGIVVKLTT